MLPQKDENISFRHPYFNDGLEIHTLIKNCPPLDLNSVYYYYVFCRDFSKTSVIVEKNNTIAGYISGYIRPEKGDTLFVWQVAVAESARGKGLGVRMLEWLVKQPAAKNVTMVETTVSPSNKSSESLFQKFAAKNNTEIIKLAFLEAEHFGQGTHEEEILFTINLR
ncbi:MAG: diaminobutyrate acetyltransferase [bacterium]|nr:diaminobutyrate acetyltransferase [bacterium]